jgi:uncharacterized membrane protein
VSGKREIRPLTSRERWLVLTGGLLVSAAVENLIPFFGVPIGQLAERGLLTAGILCTAALTILGWALFWTTSYLLRRAAASPGASRRLVRLMEPGE